MVITVSSRLDIVIFLIQEDWISMTMSTICGLADAGFVGRAFG
jgi:hypothetical protein